MEKLYKHIEKLLAYHDYVVVPELGGFVVQKYSAVIVDDCINPPTSSVAFNPLMRHSDGLLAVEVARTEGVTYRKAMELINSEVKRFKKQFLGNTGHVQFGDLGSFVKKEGENLIFTPAVCHNFLPGNLGIDNLYISQRQLLKAMEPKKVSFILPIARTFRYAAAAVFVLGMLLVSPKINDAKRTDSASFLSFTTESIINEQKYVVEPTLEKSEDNDNVISQNEDVTGLSYHVIVASLPSQYSAEKYCEKLKSTNFESARVLLPSPIKTYRVAIKSFSSKKEALKSMKFLRETDRRFHDAWVFCE